ncbi:hypothetical protein HMPREF9999_01137 [Alloprevotella sp. oral taxon 473 str. F0040]|nr:hypothetical protein HMPREF9999_01137 [Alloprevotella sp. oral taxon 473 str. F0040]
MQRYEVLSSYTNFLFSSEKYTIFAEHKHKQQNNILPKPHLSKWKN